MAVRTKSGRHLDINDSSSVLLGKSGSYALLEIIGRGAYGVVYKGLWREVGRPVAIKRVNRSRLSSDEERALQDEVNLFKHLNHQHIVSYLEAIDDPQSEYLDLVMEFVEGGSLQSITQSIRRSQSAVPTARHVFEEPVIASFIAQVLRGLSYLHQQGIVHRDIKGANILVTKDSVVKLADFGVSAATRGGDHGLSTSHMQVAGSPYWMAPEIISFEGCSLVSDIWSVGCTVIELLTGFPPYHELSDVSAIFRIVTDECPPLPDDISPECQHFLQSCFLKDVNTRPGADVLLHHAWLTCFVPTPTESNSSTALTDDRDNTIGEEVSLTTLSVNDKVGGLDRFEEADDETFEDVNFEDGLSDTVGNGDIWNSGGNEHNASSSATLADEVDPFSGIMKDPEAERETERLRKHKELWNRVKTQVSLLGSSVDVHVAACDILCSIFKEFPEQKYSLMYDPGLLPLLEILEKHRDSSDESSLVVEAMLRVALSLAKGMFHGKDDPSVKEMESRSVGASHDDEIFFGYPRVSNVRQDLCLAGFIPVVMKFCDKSQPQRVRILAARFIEEMLKCESTLHMFVACRGFTVFVDMLEPDLELYGDLSETALSGIEILLTMEKQRHKRDFCRRFAWHGLLARIVFGMDYVAKRLEALEFRDTASSTDSLDKAERFKAHVVKLSTLLQTFAARADPIVKTKMTTLPVLTPIIRLIISEHIPAGAIEPILCCLRDLSRDPQTHTSLQEAAAIDVLVQFLSGRTAADGAKARHYIISCLHNLCIVSSARQEIAAKAGLVPHLQTFIRSNDMNLRSLCIDMYSGFACSGHQARVALAKHSGVDFYVELLQMLSVPGTVRKWQARVLQSLFEWLDDNTQLEHVETRLTDADNCAKICTTLAQMRVSEVEAVLEPYRMIVSSSKRVNRSLGSSEELVSAMVKWLEQMYGSVGSAGGPRGRLLLLRILLVHALEWVGQQNLTGLISALQILLTESILNVEEAIIVREKAAQLLQALQVL